MEDGEEGQLVLVGGVGVPIGGSLNAVPVDLSVFLHVGEPGDLRAVDVAVFDQRVHARGAEATAKVGQRGGAEILVSEDEHRVLGEGLHDPGGGSFVERFAQVDVECLGAQGFAQGTELRGLCHGRSSRGFGGVWGGGGFGCNCGAEVF